MWCTTRKILEATTITAFTGDHFYVLNQTRVFIYADDTTLDLPAGSTDDLSGALDRKM